MNDLYSDAETIMNTLHNEYLTRGEIDFRNLKSLLMSSFADATDLDRLGRVLQEFGWVEYKREYGHGFVKITENGIEMMQKHGSIGEFYRSEELRRLEAINSNTPATKPKEADSQTIKRISWRFIKMGLKGIGIALLAGLVAIRQSVMPTLFDHLVIEPGIEYFQKSKPVIPPKKATKLIPKKKTDNKVLNPDTINKKLFHQK